MKNATEENSGSKKVGARLAGFAKSIVSETQERIIKAVDTNGDGKIDADEAREKAQQIACETSQKAISLASKAGENVKTGSEKLCKALSEAKIELDRKNLRPVFIEDIALAFSDGFSNPSMICIVERDRKHCENEACSGSIGYWMSVKGMEILNLFEDGAQQTHVQFYPNISKTIYYINPYQRNMYISLDEYFPYFKTARVSELSMIAKDLGAKKIRITLKEHKKTFVSKNVKAEAKISKTKMNSIYEGSDSECASVAIADEEEFSGNDIPVKPNLTYFKNERAIEELIEKRMDTDKANSILSKTYSLQYNKSSGITEKEAARIDAVLAQMKCGGTASVSSEAQSESRTILEYHIEF